MILQKCCRSELMSNGANLEVVEKKLLEIQLNMKRMDQEVKTSMKLIEDDVEEIIHLLNLETAKTQGEGFKPSLLLDFPDHLRKTVKTLLELGVASAKEVSEKTGRSRSLESTYLNNLVTMGYAKRERNGQIIYYQIQFDKAKKILGEGI